MQQTKFYIRPRWSSISMEIPSMEQGWAGLGLCVQGVDKMGDGSVGNGKRKKRKEPHGDEVMQLTGGVCKVWSMYILVLVSCMVITPLK